MRQPRFGLHFSAYHPSFAEQLKSQGYQFISEEYAKRFQRLADHCTNLRLSSMLTDGEADKVNKRIMKALDKVVIKI